MRLLASEHHDLLAAISNIGAETQDFSFVKRQGMVYIQYANHDDPFFFSERKKPN